MKKTKLSESARGEECALQIHPYCIGGTETTVLCHLPSNSGVANKSPDWWSTYGCMVCHSVLDGRHTQAIKELGSEEIMACAMRGLFRTHQRMIEKGLIRVG